MILRSIAFLLVASACLAQTTGSATDSNSPKDISALTAQANQGNPDAQLKLGEQDQELLERHIKSIV
jgi:hypothetical protein